MSHSEAGDTGEGTTRNESENSDPAHDPENLNGKGGNDVSVEEEMLVGLFRPRTSSIGTEGETESSAQYSHSIISLGNTERQLKSAEKAFLDRSYVRSASLPLDEISSRFNQTSIPSNPLKGGEGHVNEYMDALVQNTVEDAVNTASPSMIGHMTSSLPYFMRPLSRLVTTMNQNVVKTETGNTVTFIEKEAIAQLHKQIYDCEESFYDCFAQDPSTVLGILSSGGTTANLSALWAARNIVLKPQGTFEGVENEGLFPALLHYGYTGGAAVIGSELLHYSLSKSVDILGLGTKSLITIPVDDNFRVRIDMMREALEDCKRRKQLVIAVVGVAGATETGAVDDLLGIAKLAAQYETYFHVDAAWGGPLIFSSKYKHLLNGIQKADSVTLDGHKQLYMPMGCGLCFFKNPETSLAVQKTAKYIIRKDSLDLGRFTLEGSRPANAVYLHSNLNIFGVRGYEILVNRSIRIVKHMAKRINESNGLFQLIVHPTTNILLYRCIPPHLRLNGNFGTLENKEIDALNIELQRLQTLEGRTFVSRTTVLCPVFGAPIVALRVVIANPLTFEADVDCVLQNQVGILASLIELDLNDVPEPLRPHDGNHNQSVHSEKVAEYTKEKDEERVLGNILPPQNGGCDAHHTYDESYWSSYWESMPNPLRILFKDDIGLFLSSLVAPELQLEKEGGLFSAERLRQAYEQN
mmetsp:Transcript_52284/g.156917  ORF Transcript_52284/g.156917 Transcript_52284/m.156917 type:complete len:695 (-) Transcript_52284:275-2359(-)